ncbi:aromatic prenyltransferase [Stachybotrys elegans]|uniref:Aromatic prenyltransferase n=1 Tax=Stachybotrys elegans TaxID=80388 RepID=A0A8K0SLR8_9HYPO|nr:aromatic prenyltransferase [Stachybotrys elegans]
MLDEANYPQQTKHQFLDFYRDTICPLLGSAPGPGSLPTAVGWDGSPFEYSFEFKGTTRNPGVRFVLDLSQLRPADDEHPLESPNVNAVIKTLSMTSPMFDDSWHRALSRWCVYSNDTPSKQKALVAEAGFRTPTILGFDINPKITKLAPELLPVMAKSYFPPDFVGIDKGFNRFQAISLGIRQIPDIGYHPNILLALNMIENYVEARPEYESCARGLSTDFVKPGKARLKIYIRYWGDTFDDIWDFYTLGGQIPTMEGEEQKIRDLICLACGSEYPAEKREQTSESDTKRRVRFAQKPSSLYFSLSPDKPYPIPKLYFYPASKAHNDEAIAQGLDAWFKKYEWYDGGKTVEEMVSNVL